MGILECMAGSSGSTARFHRPLHLAILKTLVQTSRLAAAHSKPQVTESVPRLQVEKASGASTVDDPYQTDQALWKGESGPCTRLVAGLWGEHDAGSVPAGLNFGDPGVLLVQHVYTVCWPLVPQKAMV